MSVSSADMDGPVNLVKEKSSDNQAEDAEQGESGEQQEAGDDSTPEASQETPVAAPVTEPLVEDPVPTAEPQPDGGSEADREDSISPSQEMVIDEDHDQSLTPQLPEDDEEEEAVEEEEADVKEEAMEEADLKEEAENMEVKQEDIKEEEEEEEHEIIRSETPDERGERKRSRSPSPVILKRKKKKKLMIEYETKVRPAKKPKAFQWEEYLRTTGAKAAPEGLFGENAIPASKNGFKVAMKLEGIDPKHPHLYCVMSVAETKGHRLRLHFDGYSECYDFWTNADCDMIFPVGWAEKNGKELQPPKRSDATEFSWATHLKQSKGIQAPKTLFPHVVQQSATPQLFRVGHKLEAVDKRNTKLTCVASVADIVGQRILVHFDGWEQLYDFWCDPSSPYIHPVGWCQETEHLLSPPPEWPDIATFTWEDYLEKTKSTAAPPRAFKHRDPLGFEVGMRLEAVDRRNPLLVRAATVATIEDYMITLHFDGWSDQFDYVMEDDSRDLHPVGWCSKTGHALQPPLGPEDLASSPSQNGCPTPGCRGYGHVKGAKYTGHHSAFGCPYSNLNVNKTTWLQDRLSAGGRGDPSETKPVRPETSADPKCPTDGCEGKGHVTGKFSTHWTVSGCPLAEQKKLKLGSPSSTAVQDPPRLPRPKGRPPGSGRGRKKFRFPSESESRPGRPINRPRHHESPRREALREAIHQSVFNPPSPSAGPGPAHNDVTPCFDHNASLLPQLSHLSDTNVADWSSEEAAAFVRSLGCHEAVPAFAQQMLDGEALLLLSQDDLTRHMHLKLGPAIKIHSAITYLRLHCDDDIS